MNMRRWLMMIALTMPMAAPSWAGEPPAEGAAEENRATALDTENEDDEDMTVCEREGTTGSRLRRHTVCTKLGEKKFSNDETSRSLERLNSMGGQQAPQGR